MKRPPYANQNNPKGYYSEWNGVKTYGTAPLVIESGTFSSIKTPNFKNLKPWQRPDNPFKYSYSYEKRTEGKVGARQSAQYAFTGWGGLMHGNIAGTSFSLPTFTNTTEPIARTKLLDKLKDQTVNLAMAYAERKQTVDLIATNVNRIAQAAMSIRRGKLAHAADVLGYGPKTKSRLRDIPPSPKNLPNHWLEYSYGWRPLIGDIYGSCELIADTYYRRKPTKVIQRNSRQVPIKNHLMFVHSAYCDAEERFNGVYNERSSYVIYYLEDNAFAQRMSQTGLSNPLILAWELVPYSFVVDWFVGVGSYLNNLDATIGLQFNSGTKTLQSSLHGSTSWKTSKVKSWEGVCYTNGRQFIREDKNRTVLTSFPAPALVVDPNLGVSRVLSGIALLTQAFKR